MFEIYMDLIMQALCLAAVADIIWIVMIFIERNFTEK